VNHVNLCLSCIVCLLCFLFLHLFYFIAPRSCFSNKCYTDLFKEFRDVFVWYYEEMPCIDPKIVEHEITMYPDAKPVQQNLHLVNPKKAATIKVEVEKLLKGGFIYPIHLTQWVSNPVPANKKQCTIRVCTDFCELNKGCSKDNFPTPFIYQIIYECASCEAFSFMDGFSGYNQIQIKPEDQHKITFICPWGTFVYHKMLFGLKNAGATFQWAMYFSFHELKHIVEAYLDDLASRLARDRIIPHTSSLSSNVVSTFGFT
jgi:hypothetical protein